MEGWKLGPRFGLMLPTTVSSWHPKVSENWWKSLGHVFLVVMIHQGFQHIPLKRYMCIYIYIYIYLSIFPYIYIYIFIYIYISTSTSTFISLSLSIYIYIHTYIYIYIYMHRYNNTIVIGVTSIPSKSPHLPRSFLAPGGLRPRRARARVEPMALGSETQLGLFLGLTVEL